MIKSGKTIVSIHLWKEQTITWHLKIVAVIFVQICEQMIILFFMQSA